MEFEIDYSTPEDKKTAKQLSWAEVEKIRSDDDTKNFLKKNFIFDTSRIKKRTFQKIKC